ncbi:tetratricopeptide repeat protein [Rubrivirga sp. S365]|nr:tetratricopeptide repeat protein [Rubrivirga sp. S365]
MEVAIPDAEYVGAAACGSCHADVAAAYEGHGGTASMQRWTPARRTEPVLETPVVDPTTGFEYRVVEVEGALAQEERQLDGAGREVARLVRPMDWIVGSGTLARTYFARRGDRLVQLPLTWYTGGPGGAGRWDLSPGYEDGAPRFGRTMPARCMYCHNAVPTLVPGVEDAYAEIPEGIGCEQCHGPGSLHVDRWQNPAPPPQAERGGADPTLVDLGALPLGLRLDVCQSCHLHGTVDVYREGESAFTYRPGRPLSAHVGLFTVPELVDREGLDVASHVDRMKASACFVETQGTPRALECTSCHDPHRTFEARGPGATTAACRSCHAPPALQAAVPAALRAEHAPSADCVACHMPRVGAAGVPHAQVVDHLVRVVGDGGGATPPLALGRGGVVLPLMDVDRDGDEGGLYEGLATLQYGTRASDAAAVGVGAQFVEIALGRLPQPAARGDAQFLLGVARLNAGRVGDALAPLALAAEAPGGADRAQRLATLARALADAGRADRAAAAFRRALQAGPRRPETHRELGRFQLAQGRPARAADALRAALALDPWDAEAFLLLGLASGGADRDGAWREAVRLDPALAGVLASGRVAGSAARLWTAPGVYGWPAQSGWPGLGAAPLTVYSSSGTPVARAPSGAGWDGRGLDGRPLPPGVYLASAGGRVVRFAVAASPRPSS